MNTTTKFLIGGLVGVVILAVFISLHFLTQGSTPSVLNSPSGSDQRVQKLEQEVNTLLTEVNALSTSSATLSGESQSPNASVAQQINSLETSINNLSTRVSRLENGFSQTSTTTTQTTSTSKPPLYIPLGASGASTSLSYSSVPSIQATIDPADYPGYTSMQLEVSLQVFQGNGQAFAQLFDSTDGLALATSQVSTTSQTYVDLLSNGFNLFPGKKVYTIELKSLTGYEADVQNVRLKVNF